MSKAHIELLRSKLEASKWKIISEYKLEALTEFWLICRPNGDSQHKILFTIGGKGYFGALKGNETICDALGCSIENFSHINIYFGKYSGKFQMEIDEFIKRLNLLDTPDGADF